MRLNLAPNDGNMHCMGITELSCLGGLTVNFCLNHGFKGLRGLHGKINGLFKSTVKSFRVVENYLQSTSGGQEKQCMATMGWLQGWAAILCFYSLVNYFLRYS
jgi:hypothetical protein